MKTIILSLLLLFISSTNIFCQNFIFKMYQFECSEFFDIKIDKPKGFNVIDGYTAFKINEKKNVGGLYTMVLESKNKDCLILFPRFEIFHKHEIAAKNKVFSEVKAALDLSIEDKSLVLDTVKYIRIYMGDNMEKYFNADTVFVYKIPLKEPYQRIYNYCTGINIIKTGHPSAVIKIFFTEDGIKKEEGYMNLLFNSIHYSDNLPVEIDDEKRNIVRKKFKSKFVFHRKKYWPTYFEKF